MFGWGGGGGGVNLNIIMSHQGGEWVLKSMKNRSRN